MITKGSELRRTCDWPLVPDGAYLGTWSGYVAKFEHDGGKYEVKTVMGVRGLNIPVIISIHGEEITVSDEKAGDA